MKKTIKVISILFLLFRFTVLNVQAMEPFEDQEVDDLTSSLSDLSIDRIGWTKFLGIILDNLTLSSSDPEIEEDICRLSTLWECDKKCLADMYTKIISKFPEAERVFDFSKPEIFHDRNGIKNNSLTKATAQACWKTRIISTSNSAIILDESTGLKFGPFKDQGYIMVAAISPDKTKILTASGRKNTAVLWDVKDKKNVQLIYIFKHDNWVTSTAIFSIHDREYALTCSFDGSAKLWNIQTGELIHTFDHGTPVFTVEAGDGYIKTGSLKTEKIWPFPTVDFKMLSFRQFILAIKLQRCLESKRTIWLSRKWKKIFYILPDSLKTKFNKFITKRIGAGN